MTEENIKRSTEDNMPVGNPENAEPGKSPGGQQWGVQMAQNPNVNDPEAKIPSNVDVQENIEQVKAAAEQEEGTLPTTHGYVIGESGNLNNFAVEPPMRVEGEE